MNGNWKFAAVVFLLVSGSATAQQYETLPLNTVVGRVAGTPNVAVPQSGPSFAVGLGDLATALSGFGLVKAPNSATGGNAAVFSSSGKSGDLVDAGAAPLLATPSPAFTLFGNSSSVAAKPAAIDITALPSKASPGINDVVLIQDSSAGNAFKKTTVSALGSPGSVSSLNGQTGALIGYFAPQGRLTLTSGTAVMTTSVSAANNVFYTPYAGDLIPLYNGTNIVPTQFTEVSQFTTDTTKSPAAVVANTCYDELAWSDSGTFRVTRGNSWSSTTSRGTGAGTAELQLQNGIYLNKQAVTNGPAALRGTYVGSICSNASSLIDFNLGAVSAGATPAVLNIWNQYNRVDVDVFVGDSTTNWNYTTTTNTWRQANNNANAKVTFLRGQNEDSIEAIYFGQTGAVTGTTNCALGIGLDSVTAVSGNPMYAQTTTSPIPVLPGYVGTPPAGQHFLAPLELITVSTGCTIYGSSGVAYAQSGLRVKVKM
ncbi:hypothetical protein ACFQZO_23505 [Bradyrhizobium sp. GCM10027634]|uniref:hypothetical protein n=1 Tax=unclassified Bradyrhizobium TaxID=2631580 RepID=UPI00263AB54E|nr:hypothetical protein [Bradyrhizobium sp. WYCCWR 12677]MDN5003807.1 hypothetical protein [Bradyrhizobium sp. WYCCWR 12677]